MGHSIFVTGTDTGVGKTFFTTGLIRVLRELGLDVGGFKPIECGGRRDSEEIRAACGEIHDLDAVNPVWFEQPLAPLAAAESPDDISLEAICQAHKKMRERHELILVEGAGGWLVPITPDFSMASLAAELCDEVIIVAANRLGVINHTILTWRSVREKGLDCERLILNRLPKSCDSTGCSEGPYPIESADFLAVNDLSLASNAEVIQQCIPGLGVFDLRDENCFGRLARELME